MNALGSIQGSTSLGVVRRATLLHPHVVARWSRNGKPLPAALRRHMQARLGVDLGSVRVHVGAEPAGIGCAAFCHGERVYLSPDLYPPVEPWQFAVLVHELTHVVQQREGWVVNPFGRGTAIVDDGELEAWANAANGAGDVDNESSQVPRSSGSVWRAASRSGSVVQCIHYQNMTELGHQYRADPGAGQAGEEGTSGHRYPASPAITTHENNLKAAIVKLANLNQMAHPPARPPGSRPLPIPPGIDAQIVVAAAKVDKIRTWLEREDFVLFPDGSINWAMSNKTVVYDHQLAAQDATRIHGKGGRLFVDERCTTPLDTSGMVTHLSGPGYAIYVMSQQGHIHVSTHKLGHRHHSSLLAGGNVAGAGELKTSPQGALLWLSNKSGHYAPSPIHLNQVIHQFDKLGAPKTYAIKEFSGPTGQTKKDFGSAADYLANTANGIDSPQYELQKLLAFSAVLTDAVLGRNDWEWKDGTSGWGVYKRFTQHMVPHKQARQWLKRQRVANVLITPAVKTASSMGR